WERSVTIKFNLTVRSADALGCCATIQPLQIGKAITKNDVKRSLRKVFMASSLLFPISKLATGAILSCHSLIINITSPPEIGSRHIREICLNCRRTAHSLIHYLAANHGHHTMRLENFHLGNVHNIGG